jgi:hypothetical protein
MIQVSQYSVLSRLRQTLRKMSDQDHTLLVLLVSYLHQVCKPGAGGARLWWFCAGLRHDCGPGHRGQPCTPYAGGCARAGVWAGWCLSTAWVLDVWWNRAIYALLQLMTAPSNSGRCVQKLTYLAGFVSGSSRSCLGSFQLICGELKYSRVHHQAKVEGKVIEMSRLHFAENDCVASWMH